ncbi:MAG: aminotransferase class I/II-fold pyridoxal phosphate-dependent enzyme [Chitinivibrionales bacterium]|nr:aminotransferase class I/II-fold pyridoxal phosphate-dependent enzyme [Chitinivibrionales bacterium]
MQFIDLKAQQALIETSLKKRIETVLSHGKYIMGPEIFELEEKLANYCGVKHCVCCSSGTDALLLALMAYDIGPGDAVFTTPFTFIATAEVISLLGATPVFVDINPETFNIDAGKLQQAIADVTSGKKSSPGAPEGLKPRGVIPVDIFGCPAEYDTIGKVARENNLFVLEDACQSFGARYKNKRACSLGDMAATSFFPAKPLGCYGDGGAVFLNDDALSEKITSIRIHGQGSNKYDNVRIGLNGRMDTMQAAVLLCKLDLFDKELENRQGVAHRYGEALSGGFTLQTVPEHSMSAWAQYAIVSDNRDEIIGKLKAANIPAAIYYPKPLHLQDAFSLLGHTKGDFPVSESIADRIFSVPFHPYLEKEDQQRIIKAIRG